MGVESGQLTDQKMWQEHEQVSQRQREWSEVDRENGNWTTCR